MDLGGRYGGTLSSSMNMMGAFGGGGAPLVIGILLDTTSRDWSVRFWISDAIFFSAGFAGSGSIR